MLLNSVNETGFQAFETGFQAFETGFLCIALLIW
jgi:hypothetical protein